LVAADALAAGGEEADVIVLGTAFPRRRDRGQGETEEQPAGTDQPGVPGCDAPDEREHASCPPPWIRVLSPYPDAAVRARDSLSERLCRVCREDRQRGEVG